MKCRSDLADLLPCLAPYSARYSSFPVRNARSWCDDWRERGPHATTRVRRGRRFLIGAARPSGPLVFQSDFGVSDIRGLAKLQSVVVVDPYGLTATTASSSVVGRCRDVTVTHSPGFTVLIADKPVSGSLTRIVMD